MKKELVILILAIIASVGFSGAVAAQPMPQGPMHGPTVGHFVSHHPVITHRHFVRPHFFVRHHFIRHHFFVRHHFIRHHRLY